MTDCYIAVCFEGKMGQLPNEKNSLAYAVFFIVFHINRIP